MTKRLKYLDMAKAFAFLWVVLGHTYYQLPESANRFAFAFHMPLFFIISGYFISTDVITKKFVFKSFKSLILPYVYTAIVIIIINIIKDVINGVDILPNILKWTNAMFYGSGSRVDWSYWPTTVNMMGATWFLLALFWGRIILVSILTLFKEKTQLQFFSVVFVALAGYYMANNGEWFPLSFYAGMTCTFFIYLGYLCKKNDIFNKNFPCIVYIIFLVIAIYCTVKCKPLYMVGNRYNGGIMNVIGAISISFLVIKFFKFWEEKLKFGVNFISYVGQNTLLLISLHMFEGKFTPWSTKIPTMLIENGLSCNWYIICALRCSLLLVMLFVTKALQSLSLIIIKKFKDKSKPITEQQ